MPAYLIKNENELPLTSMYIRSMLMFWIFNTHDSKNYTYFIKKLKHIYSTISQTISNLTQDTIIRHLDTPVHKCYNDINILYGGKSWHSTTQLIKIA